MSAYFRMSDRVFDCACARELARCAKGDSGGPFRVLIFIRLLNAALYPSKCFVDAQSIADCFGAPLNQAKKVFETCIRFGVLSWSGYGYNARKWIIDNGLIGRYDKEKEGKEKETEQAEEPSFPSWVLSKGQRDRLATD